MWVCLADTIYVATCNPVSLYSMKERGDTIHCMELYDVFPRTISGVWQPFVTVAPLGSPLDGQVVLHEEQVGTGCTFTHSVPDNSPLLEQYVLKLPKCFLHTQHF